MKGALNASDLFQSTLPRRERRIKTCEMRLETGISIHAPAKGATRYRLQRFVSHAIFQSTLPRRERPNNDVKKEITQIFQSTLPRRERLEEPNVTGAKGDFNPRSREGSDVNDVEKVKGAQISIHAPAKGATWWAVLTPMEVIFQSTLPRRERLERHCVSQVQ